MVLLEWIVYEFIFDYRVESYKKRGKKVRLLYLELKYYVISSGILDLMYLRTWYNGKEVVVHS